MSAFQEFIIELAQDVANQGYGSFGVTDPKDRTIFWGEMPSEVRGLDDQMHKITEGLLLVDVASPAPHQYVDTEYLVIDFWAKSASSYDAKALLRSIYDKYHRRYDWNTANWHVYWSRALGNIIDADREREGGKLFRLSVQFIVRNLNNVS